MTSFALCAPQGVLEKALWVQGRDGDAPVYPRLFSGLIGFPTVGRVLPLPGRFSKDFPGFCYRRFFWGNFFSFFKILFFLVLVEKKAGGGLERDGAELRLCFAMQVASREWDIPHLQRFFHTFQRLPWRRCAPRHLDCKLRARDKGRR